MRKRKHKKTRFGQYGRDPRSRVPRRRISCVISAEYGAIKTLIANHMVASDRAARVSRFLPTTKRSTKAARNGINAVATRAWGLN